MKKYKFLFFTLLLGFLFFPKDAFALEIDNVKFFNNNQLVHTFTKQDLQGGYASVDPVLVDAFHINYVDANLKTNYVYDFEANFNMAGNRLFNDVVDFFVYASPFGSTSNLLTSTDSWFLYSAEQVSPYYNGEYIVNSSFTSTVNSNNLRFQYDLGDELILSSFRLNNAKLTNDGQDVGDVISNQTQELLENQNKNQQQTNEKLDSLDKTITDSFTSCHVGKNLFNKDVDPILHMYVDTTNNVFVDNYSSTYSTFIFLPIDAGSTYTISKLPGKTFRVATSAELPRSGVSVLSTIANHTGGSITITTPNNAKYLFVNYYNSDNGDTVGEQTMRNSLQIEKGSFATSYEPYEFVCKNRIDETNDKLDNLDKTLNDDNVSGATSTGNDFFDNFNSSNNGGISGIITAPLNAINAMLNGTCQPLSTTFKDKTISLQCGTDMWNKLSGIRDFLNLVLGGLLCYQICLKIFHIVQNLKNPDNDKVEVMNL